MKEPLFESIEQVSSGWINKYLLTFLRPDGSHYVYEAVSRKKLEQYKSELEGGPKGIPVPADGICMACVTAEDQVLLIREFRYPLNSWCIAFPAGLIDPGEDVTSSITRELSEETGYRVIPGTTPTLLKQSGFSSTGLGNENVQIVFAQVEPAGEAHTESNELIEPFLLPRSEIRHFLDTNTLPIGTRCQLLLELLAIKPSF